MYIMEESNIRIMYINNKSFVKEYHKEKMNKIHGLNR